MKTSSPAIVASQSHTPTPWNIVPDSAGCVRDTLTIYGGPSQRQVCTLTAIPADFTRELANASFICEAVNSYVEHKARIAQLEGALKNLIEAADLAQFAMTPIKASPRQPQVNGALALLPSYISAAREALKQANA